MDKSAAARDIASHFIQDYNDGVFSLGTGFDPETYRVCVAEYGYGDLAGDAEVRKIALARVNEWVLEQKKSTDVAPVLKSLGKLEDPTTAAKLIVEALEKSADLQPFQYDIILSLLSEHIAPLVIGSGNIPILFAYHAVRKLVEGLRNKQMVAQESSTPTVLGEPTSYPVLDAPTYSAKEAALSNEEIEEVGEDLAECAHERWMEREKAKGNPNTETMVPYEQLPEEDKESDRDYAYEFMALLEENGFDIVPVEDDEEDELEVEEDAR